MAWDGLALLLVTVIAVAALGVIYLVSRDEGLPHRIVVPAGTTEQFTYSHLFGHTVACAKGGAWQVTPKPTPISTSQIRVQFILDAYVNVSCPSGGTDVYGVGVGQRGIIRHTRWNPVSLIALAVLVLPFALNGRTEGLVLAVIVWVVVAVLLVWWWRGRHEPRPPDHAA
jgi:hypothetical protein